MTSFLVLIGLGIGGATLAVIFWSIVRPSRKVWPPKQYTSLTPVLVWVPTLSLFGILIILGVLGWGQIATPEWLRYGVGLPLIVLGNVAVWYEVRFFGIHQTGGARGSLRIDGLYRYSRNPQYVADVCIVLGWIVLSSAPWAAVVAIPGIAALLAAPFSEEPWLREQYGPDYDQYASKVRRFI